MRFFFLDGSALAKRYVAEPGTPLLDQLFDQVAADRLVVLNVGVAEVVSILVRRKNAGTLSAATFSQEPQAGAIHILRPEKRASPQLANLHCVRGPLFPSRRTRCDGLYRRARRR